MSIARKILASTGYQVIGKLITIALSIVTIKVITSYLGGVEGYGEYTTIYEFLAFFAVGADMGIYTIAIREISRDRNSEAKILGNIVGLRLVLVITMMLLAVVTAFMIPQYASTRIALGVSIAAFSIFFTMLHGSMCSLLQVHYKMAFATLSSVFGKIIVLSYILFVVYYLTPRGLPVQTGFFHLLIAGVIGNFCMYLMVHWYSHRLIRWRIQFDFAFWKSVMKYTLPYGIAIILNTLYFRIDTILLTLLRADYLLQAGIYGVAVRVLEALNIIPIYFMNSVLPVLSKYVEEGSERVGLMIRYSCLFLALMGFPLVFGGIIFGREIVSLVSTENFLSNYAEGYLGSDVALQVLFFALLIAFFNTMLGYSLVAHNQQSKLLWVNGSGALFNIVLNIIFIPYYGFLAAAATSILSELLVLTMLYYSVRRLVSIDFGGWSFIKIVFAALLMAAIIYLLHTGLMIHWLLLVPLGALIYGIFILMFGVVTKDMQRIVFRREIF